MIYIYINLPKCENFKKEFNKLLSSSIIVNKCQKPKTYNKLSIDIEYNT